MSARGGDDVEFRDDTDSGEGGRVPAQAGGRGIDHGREPRSLQQTSLPAAAVLIIQFVSRQQWGTWNRCSW
jgi:hypothetical protein